ncbi:dihydrofolate reductase family protein [Streptomyces sp. NA03103]|uniref:dihydrofolate reductase family protein n=1 Tax=unclassified Streptomyces TaxID=2593676 RepID=UPI0015919A8A|nr:dihydrofolate reductase family protein [Streptomyces sp. NA03103]QKW59120.1 dihydrofolate reductase family protein [Streptomyces sp. NA03103]
MTHIIADISISLDGYVTGPDPGPGNGLGTGGEALHTWAFSDDPEERRIVRETTARSGAVVLGRRLFDLVDGPGGWDDTVGYGAAEVGRPAFVVVTGSKPESVRLTGLDWTFVTTGLSDALAVARDRAEAASADRGEDLDVVLMGGGALIGSALDAGLVDVLSLHLAPVVLGSGTPLFTGGTPRTLVRRSANPTPNATHLTYAVHPGASGWSPARFGH